MDVSATAIRGGWVRASPFVEMENVQFAERAAKASAERPAGTPALKLPGMRVSISWWSLLAGQIRFSELAMDGPELVLSRRADGLIYFAGRAINEPAQTPDDGQLLSFLLEQPGVEIRNASLVWEDALNPGKSLRFTDLGLIIKQSAGTHRIGLVASPPLALASKLQATGDLRLSKAADRWDVVGRIYGSVTDANVQELRLHVSVPTSMQTGIGNLRTWVDVDTTKVSASKDTAASAFAAFQPVRAITTDVNIANASVLIEPGLPPLNLAKLAGRIDYKAETSGFSVGSKGLELRTREGVVLPPADFALALHDQADAAKARGEVKGNGIDLKVMTSLLVYFPVGKELRSMLARLSPHGMVRDSTFTWTGDIGQPRTYQLKASLSDFALNAHEKTPGVAGFSGDIEGDSTGGVFKIAAKDFTFDAPEQFAAPLRWQQFTSDGKWKVSNDAIEITFDKLLASNADLALDLAGGYSRYRAGGAKAKQEKGPGAIDLRGKITRANAKALADYLPTSAKLHDYLKFAVQGGEITSADLLVKGELFEFPFHEGKGGQFKLDANLKNVDLLYSEGWPAANQINGQINLQNTKFSATLDSARIFNAALKKTTLLIADTTRRPSVLGITGEVDARAEDVTRYLRESPLINSVGGFTKFVTLEGPGKLNLDLNIPLGTSEEKAAAKLAFAMKGDYTLTRGSAKVAIGNAPPTLLSNLSGNLTFSESGVKSNSVQGTAFGHPLTVNIVSQDNAVITEFAARADVTQLRDLLPFKMPQQITGTTDFRGRLVPKPNGMDITIDSTMVGMTFGLPYPLAKRSEEPRPLRLLYTNPGQTSERIRVTLDGAVAVDRPKGEAETRIEARFQRRADGNGGMQGFAGGIATVGETTNSAPIPEGMWIEGALPRFDMDQWRRAFAEAYPAATAAAPDGDGSTKNGESILAGFDAKLGGLIAYGRPFSAMTLRGRHGAEDWRFVVESAEANGDFTWRPGAFEDRGAVRARLKNLVLADAAKETPPAGSSAVSKDAELPALDIVADSFTLKDRWLGKLELRATPQVDNWKIDQLLITSGHAKLEMDGLWQRYGDPAQAPAADALARSRTVMNVKLESGNLNAFMGQFGFAEQIRGGSGKLNGRLAWPGHSYDFAVARLSGEFKLEASNGAFTKVEAGAGKLLALISLQSLPRRFTFDFRDVFSNGFAFDRIGGDVKITNGLITTQNFEIYGPSAEVKMAGDISLPTERANLTFTVIPRLDETVALGAGLATLNPLVGLAVFVGQKVIGNPFEKMFTFKYAVTGPWDNPEVERVGRGPAVPPETPAKTPSSEATPVAATAAK